MGKALRSKLSRSSFGGWKRPDKRTDPIDVLKAADAGRLPEQGCPARKGQVVAFQEEEVQARRTAAGGPAH